MKPLFPGNPNHVMKYLILWYYHNSELLGLNDRNYIFKSRLTYCDLPLSKYTPFVLIFTCLHKNAFLWEQNFSILEGHYIEFWSYEVRERHKICLLDTINQGVAKDNVLKTGIKLYKYDHKTIKINTSWYYMSHTFLQMNLVDEEGGYKTTHQ